jgi:hypothetical protein
MPRGKIHRLAGISIEKSMVLPVRIVCSGPMYTTRVQAWASTAKAKTATNITLIQVFFIFSTIFLLHNVTFAALLS